VGAIQNLSVVRPTKRNALSGLSVIKVPVKKLIILIAIVPRA
jgi:hypothetical protein